MTINCKGQLLDLNTPKVMGILNVTPDSFYDGGNYKLEKEILQQVANMLGDGATSIDIGAYSTKPGAAEVTLEEELSRIAPIITAIHKHFPEAMLSIDTFRPAVAHACLDLGAALINDISAASFDERMLAVIAQYQVPYVIMHMRGTPQTMQTLTAYDDLTKEVLFYFSEKIALARTFGINDLIVDPGFGFAKTIDQNFELLNKLDILQLLKLPVLVGVSRKSMIYKTLNSNADEALNGTTALNTIALTKGAKILRVHDVKAAVECIQLFNKLTL